MKTLIAILIIASFLQSTILPINLVLIILICRSFIKLDRANLFLAFSFGLFDSHLNLLPLGLNSLFYLILIQTTQTLSKFRLAGNLLLIAPLSLILLVLYQQTISLFLQQTPQIFPRVFWESLAALPILYLVRLWEERFIVHKDIRLKI
ncbi:hypothetical protein A3C26_00270 [Candidatus Daviesbacteria bacterium RIFCSPHIGHO2_02_FULL_39_12]|uniref:Rod shape-determining protein MreD n=2 Tax=Candidatus Daviesiibacteriota TaxID=1752718 RepID=A0A1F5J8L7_9BACT|nr:MAG: hypothetical protein A3C26_00270 [Candidatus Daviesbacteria bacterium RIFCSPHIGHO2_02_FULL_39_12]OGE72283.1 MAG: hypothetical protein A3H40_02200 [Candidatus Daviesbacteria bacterium RIFCSPLOWO2_02_FULL_38_15]OGI07128.1 MAG: hypothetical protein A3F80_05100 [Candidatus Melainabacteria bacterium RIFCSPLOWO2_12_FULL_35_11]